VGGGGLGVGGLAVGGLEARAEQPRRRRHGQEVRLHGGVQRAAGGAAPEEADTDGLRSELAYFFEVFERSRSKSSPLEKLRSKLANPVELTGFDRGCLGFQPGLPVLTGIC